MLKHNPIGTVLVNYVYRRGLQGSPYRRRGQKYRSGRRKPVLAIVTFRGDFGGRWSARFAGIPAMRGKILLVTLPTFRCDAKELGRHSTARRTRRKPWVER
jgi:hypothetical protein